MSFAYQIKPTVEKRQEISKLLSDYWGNDVWDIRDSFFDDLRPAKWGLSNKTIDFSVFKPPIKDEIKYMYAYRLHEKEIRLISVIAYGSALKRLSEFLNIYYSGISSILDVPYDKFLLQWRSFLVDKGMSINDNDEIANTFYEAVFNQPYCFFTNFYDPRNEYEKDIWDCRKIPGAMITENGSNYLLNFEDIPLEFRGLVKKFIKFRTTNNSQSQCKQDIMTLRLFTKYIHTQEPSWKDLKMLTRKHMENYLSWYRDYSDGRKDSRVKYLISLRIFLDYIQRAMYPEAPELPSVCLLFKEDIPRIPKKNRG